VTSVVRASDRSFQVKWIETVYERGAQAGNSHWTAILTVVLKTPSSADELRKNPLGLYVDAIDWSRELEPPGSPPPATPSNRTAPPANIPVGSPLDPNLAPSTNLETHP
jgi:type IV secretion system protein VirB5